MVEPACSPTDGGDAANCFVGANTDKGRNDPRQVSPAGGTLFATG